MNRAVSAMSPPPRGKLVGPGSPVALRGLGGRDGPAFLRLPAEAATIAPGSSADRPIPAAAGLALNLLARARSSSRQAGGPVWPGSPPTPAPIARQWGGTPRRPTPSTFAT